MREKLTELQKFIKKEKWLYVEEKYLESTPDKRMELAVELGKKPSDSGYNFLVQLLSDSDPAIVLQAVKSLGETAGDRIIAQFHWMLSKLTPEQTELKETILAAITSVKTRATIV